MDLIKYVWCLIHSLRNRLENLAKGLLFFLFLKLELLQINFIFSDNVVQCTFVFYMYIYMYSCRHKCMNCNKVNEIYLFWCCKSNLNDYLLSYTVLEMKI